MLQIIIFSFNRAIQLDALLASLTHYWESPDYLLDVVYNTSSESFEKGYQILKDKHANNDRISFHKEGKNDYNYGLKEILNPFNLKRLRKYPYLRNPKTNFRQLTISLMKKSKADNVVFLTDDSVFVQPVNIPNNIFEWIADKPTSKQFSLRIGEGMNEQPSQGITKSNGLLSWNVNDCPKDINWGYQFSVDGHIYNKTCIIKLFSLYMFCNPNSLEGYICNMVRRKGWFNEAKSFSETRLLSFPINMVQQVEDNESMGVSTEMMNDYYLKGYSLEYKIPEKIEYFQVYPEEIYFIKDAERIVKRIK